VKGLQRAAPGAEEMVDVDTIPAVPTPLSPDEVAALTGASGIPLSAYRPGHVAACVERALGRNGLAAGGELAGHLRRHEAARLAFRRSVLVPVTSMFRDPAEFDLLASTLLPELLETRPGVDVWSAGCATGEELRSVAVLLDQHGALEHSFLLGSDVLEEALAAAVRATGELAPAMRAALRYERRDLLADELPFRRFDLVLCRNVAIYLQRPAQDALRQRLASALRPGGLLMLGRSETLLRPEGFGLEQVHRHVFRRTAP
jgi:chemotaxis protein methyltransferase CheR